jgi:hypothetical protein
MSQESFSSKPSYTYPVGETAENQGEQQEQSVVTTNHSPDDFDPFHALEELQQYVSSLRPLSFVEPFLPFIFIPRPASSHYNPTFMLTQLMLLMTANSYLVSAAEHSEQPGIDELLPHSTADDHSALQFNPMPSPTPIDNSWTVSSLNKGNLLQDTFADDKQSKRTLSDELPSLLTKTGEKFASLLLKGNSKEAKNFIEKFQQEHSYLPLNNIRDLKGRSLLEMAIANDYRDDKVILTKYLLDAGCDVNTIGSDGRVLLSSAAGMPNPNKELIKLLLSKKYAIDINKTGTGSKQNQCTALEVVINRILAGEDQFELAHTLIDAEADVWARSPLTDPGHSLYVKISYQVETDRLNNKTPKEKLKKLEDLFSHMHEKANQQILSYFDPVFAVLGNIFSTIFSTPLKAIVLAAALSSIPFHREVNASQEKQLRLQLENITSLKKLLPDSKEAQPIKDEIDQLQHQLTAITTHNQQNLPETTTTYQQLREKAEAFIKEFLSENIQGNLNHFRQIEHLLADSKETTPRKDRITKSKNGLTNLQQSFTFDGMDDRQRLGKYEWIRKETFKIMDIYNTQDSLDELQKQLKNLTFAEEQLPASEKPKINHLKDRIRISLQTMDSNLENGQPNSDETDTTYLKLQNEITSFLIEKLPKQAKIWSGKLTSLEQLLPDSKEAQNIKSEIRTLENKKTTLSHNFSSNQSHYHQITTEIITTQKQLQNKAETCIKEHISEQIQTGLSQLASFESQATDIADTEVIKSKTNKLQDEMHAFLQTLPSDNTDDQQDLEQITATSKQILTKAEELIKEYLSKKITILSAELRSIEKQLPASEEAKQIKKQLHQQLKKNSPSALSSVNFHDQQNIKKIIGPYEELLSATKEFIEKKLLKQLQARLNTLASLETQLQNLAESKPIKNKIINLSNEARDLLQNHSTSPNGHQKLKTMIVACENLQKEAQELIGTSAKNQQQMLLDRLNFVEKYLPDSAKEIRITLREQYQKISLLIRSPGNEHDSQKLKEARITYEQTLTTAETIIKEKSLEQLPEIEAEIIKLKDQLTTDGRNLLQAITGLKESNIVTAANTLRGSIESTIDQTNCLLSEAKSLYKEFSISRFNSLKDNLSKKTDIVERLHQKTIDNLSKLKHQEKTTKPHQQNKEEDKISTKPKRIPAGSAENLNSAGIFSSTASSSISTQPTSQSLSAPAIESRPRNIMLALELINEMKSIYTKMIKPTTDNGAEPQFLSYLQRACLFFSLQSLIENMDEGFTGYRELINARHCLVHNLPLTKEVFGGAEKCRINIFLAFIDLLQPLNDGLTIKGNSPLLHKLCETTFGSTGFKKSTINRLAKNNPADSKTSSSPKLLTLADIEQRLDKFTRLKSRFETSANNQDKTKLSTIASAFFAAELDARISDEADPTQKTQLKQKVNDWLDGILRKGRINRHNSTELLLQHILATESPTPPTDSKAQKSKPTEREESTQQPPPEESTSSSSSSSPG